METREPVKTATRIGDILRECGMVTSEELERALEFGREKKIRLGEALVRLGILREDQLIWALGVQFDLSYVDLHPDMIDWELLGRLPIARLIEMRLLPLTATDDEVVAVIADPTATGLTRTLREWFPNHRVIVQLADERAIVNFLESARRTRAGEGGLARPRTPPGRPGSIAESSGAYAEWLRWIESGEADSVAAWFPRSGMAGQEAPAHVWCRRDTVFEMRRSSGGDIESLIEALTQGFPRQSSWEWGFVSRPEPFRAAGAGGFARAGMLEALGHRVVALEALGSDPPPRERAPVVLVHDATPPWAKVAILKAASGGGTAEKPVANAEAPAKVLSLESRIDFVAPGVTQAEIVAETARLEAARWARAALRPLLLLVELDSLDALASLAAEPSWSPTERVVVTLRASRRDDDSPQPPPGVEVLRLPGDVAAERLFHDLTSVREVRR